MSRAHVLAVTSVREGWGLVVSEAAALGTPTVAYRVPGLRESVTAAGGVLVEPTVSALSAGLTELLRLRPDFVPNTGGVATWPVVAEAIMHELQDVAEMTDANLDR